MRLYLGNLMYLESIEIRRYCAQNSSAGSSVYRCLRKVICEKLLLRVAPSCLSVHLHICPSVHLPVHIERLDFHLTAGLENIALETFTKTRQGLPVLFKTR